MKKTLTLVLLIALITLLATGCSTSTTTNTSSKTTTNTSSKKTTTTKEPDHYSEDFDEIKNALVSLGEDANLVATCNILLWQEAGPDDVSYSMLALLQVGLAGNTNVGMWKYPYIGYLNKAFSYNVVPNAKKYATASQNLSSGFKEVMQSIQNLKAKYPDHEAGIKALQDFYSKAEAYANFALNPSGNRLNYQSNNETYQKEMREMKNNAEFSK